MDPSVLSLVDKSVRIIPLTREEWKNKINVYTKNDSSVTTANDDYYYYHLQNDLDSCGDDSTISPSWVYPSDNAFRKACQFTASDAQRPSTRNRKSLVAAIEKWIFQNHKHRRRKPSHPTVKVISMASNTGGQADSSLEAFIEKVSLEEPVEKNVQAMNQIRSTPIALGCALWKERDPARSLLVQSHRTLIDGEIQSGSSLDDHKRTILNCGASLYYRIWYFRTMQQKDLNQAFGFAITASLSSVKATIRLWITLLWMEKPVLSGDSVRDGSTTIGGRYPLSSFTTEYELPMTATKNTSSATILQDLANFLFGTATKLPCPYRDSAWLNRVGRSPGCMLLPFCGRKSLDIENDARASEPTGKLLVAEGCEVVPTITGSLVIKCRGAKAVQNVLSLGDTDAMEENLNMWMPDVAVATTEETADASETVWYVKYKTPSFGPFWDLSRMAITGSRSLLLKKKLNSAIKRWLFVHPVDSFFGDARSITITRSAGMSLSEALPNISWDDFRNDFKGLVQSTLEIQNECHSLVHGDINEGNLRFETKENVGSRFALIDWDEALRPKPCPRVSQTDEERLRYPSSLLDFPMEYTQQQLLHLFGGLVWKYYPSTAEEALRSPNTNECNDTDDSWMRSILQPFGSNCRDDDANASETKRNSMPIIPSPNFIGRAAVANRFRDLLNGLKEPKRQLIA